VVDLADVYIAPVAAGVPGTQIVVELFEIAKIISQSMRGRIALMLQVIGEAIDVLLHGALDESCRLPRG
jgi:hypothetical protein